MGPRHPSRTLPPSLMQASQTKADAPDAGDIEAGLRLDQRDQRAPLAHSPVRQQPGQQQQQEEEEEQEAVAPQATAGPSTSAPRSPPADAGQGAGSSSPQPPLADPQRQRQQWQQQPGPQPAEPPPLQPPSPPWHGAAAAAAGGSDASDGGPAECVICLEPYAAGDVVKRLPACGHEFHADCIDSWLVKQATCPLCKDTLWEPVPLPLLPLWYLELLAVQHRQLAASPDGSGSGSGSARSAVLQAATRAGHSLTAASRHGSGSAGGSVAARAAQVAASLAAAGPPPPR
jgi:hypothetical protein